MRIEYFEVNKTKDNMVWDCKPFDTYQEAKKYFYNLSLNNGETKEFWFRSYTQESLIDRIKYDDKEN